MPFLPSQLMHDTFVSARRIAGAQADTIVIVHGERDTVVPAFLGRRLYAAAPHGIFMSVEDADHLNLRGVRDAEILDIVLNGYPPEPTPQTDPTWRAGGQPRPLRGQPRPAAHHRPGARAGGLARSDAERSRMINNCMSGA
jgi:fermentation-respiration switch protein FrsA (DUF1100 family)